MPARAEPRAPSLVEALLLGVLHGPAELLPISSSGHLTLVPWLLGRDQTGRDPEERKAFEVAPRRSSASTAAARRWSPDRSRRPRSPGSPWSG